MQFEYTPPQTILEEAFGGHRCINAFGPVTAGDDERFLDFLSRSSIPVRTDVYIDSSGGHVETAINIGRAVRDNWFSTHVGQYVIDYQAPYELEGFLKPRRFIEGSCISAATLLYLGGRLRYLSKSARFGVHQFSFRDPSPSHVGRSQILSSRIARYISDMGIAPEFLEISASVESNEIKLVDHDKLHELGIVTDGQTPVTWTVQSRNNTLYVRAERDSLYGHHKLMLGFVKPDFYLHAVIESQGRESHLTQFPLVELVVGQNDGRIVDLSGRCTRHIHGIYTNVFSKLSTTEANDLAFSDGFGLRVRGGPDADMFLGIAPMSTSGGEDLIRSFVHSLS